MSDIHDTIKLAYTLAGIQRALEDHGLEKSASAAQVAKAIKGGSKAGAKNLAKAITAGLAGHTAGNLAQDALIHSQLSREVLDSMLRQGAAYPVGLASVGGGAILGAKGFDLASKHLAKRLSPPPPSLLEKILNKIRG